MNVYAILFYLREEHNHHEHSEDCGCGHNHESHNHRDDYDIVATIKSLGPWANFMPDSYLVKSEFTAKEITEKLQKFIQTGDLLFVSKIDKDDVSSLTPEVENWILS
ncbi:MAG: hypothetical protein GX889_10900 [Clostridiales bacterium]|nr:hypothetical protein [Clostridiales bacterium]